MTAPMPADAPERMDREAYNHLEKHAELLKSQLHDAHLFIQKHALWSVFCAEVHKIGL